MTTREPRPPYWFLARRSGGGWGPPVTWQGLALFALLPLAAVVPALLFAVLPDVPAAALSALLVVLLLAVFLVVALRHAEPLDRNRPPVRPQQPPVGRPGANTHRPGGAG